MSVITKEKNMARKPTNDFTGLIVLLFSILLFPIFIIKWIVDKDEQSRTNKQINQNHNKLFNNTPKLQSNMPKYFREFNDSKAKRDAKIKLNEIDKEKTKAYCEKRKKYYKTLFTIIVVLLSIYSALTLALFLVNIESIEYIVLFSLGLTSILISIIIYCVNIKKPTETIALKQIETELQKTYRNLNDEKFYNYKKIVIKSSSLYKSITNLNDEYSFEYDKFGRKNYTYNLNSKRALDNYDFDKSLANIINERLFYYTNLKENYENNLKLYDEYSKRYNEIKQFTNRKNFEKLKINIDYEIFNYIENYLYIYSKKNNIEIPSLKIVITYTSPTGRNHYERDELYIYSEIIKMVEDIELEKENLIKSEEKKQIMANEKRQKEKRLRELDKLERQLKKKEKELIEKENEFKEATKGHIYSSSVIINEEKHNTSQEKTRYQKLKKLKEQYENGEITREEYNKKRNDLL